MGGKPDIVGEGEIVPDAVAARGTSSSTVDVSWSMSRPDSDGQINGYKLRYRIASNTGDDWVAGPEVSYGTAARDSGRTTTTLSGLKPCTEMPCKWLSWVLQAIRHIVQSRSEQRRA